MYIIYINVIYLSMYVINIITYTDKGRIYWLGYFHFMLICSCFSGLFVSKKSDLFSLFQVGAVNIPLKILPLDGT